MDGREAAQVTVTVLSARNLQSRKKGDTCIASVVFGVGKDCYTTERITSDSPDWNQEARISLPQRSHSSEIKFKVRDKDHSIGIATVTIGSLRRERELSKKWLPLKPHKKSYEAHGEILVECFVSETRPAVSKSENPSLSNSQEELYSKGGLVRGRFSLHRRNPSWSKTSSVPTSPSPKRLSVQDVEGRGFTSEGTMISSLDQSRGSEVSGDSMISSDAEAHLTPEVTGISPREGPVSGGQRVVLRGLCLGEFKADVLRVVIADVDCTHSLEYHSQSKLIVTTGARHSPGLGPVLVETRSGGIGTSSLKFTFTTGEVSNPPEVTGISPREGPVGGGERVVLRGSFLGESRGDVLKVLIADVDCTQSLEYMSQSKLVVTTPAVPEAVSGPVVIETALGGMGKSSLLFSFIATLDQKVGVAPVGVVSVRGMGSTPPIERKPEIDPVEYKALKQKLRDLKDDNCKLKDENSALRAYIDALLLTVMESRPDLLEVKPTPAIPVSHSNVSLSSSNNYH